jgi:Tol biopolymer transport system component
MNAFPRILLSSATVALCSAVAPTQLTTTRASLGAGGAEVTSANRFPSISADGRWIAFESDAADLVPGDTNGFTDVFVRDLGLPTTVRASVSWSGVEGDGPSGSPSISGDGRWVAFTSSATNLVPGDTNGVADVFVRDLLLHRTVRVSVSTAGLEGDNPSARWSAESGPSISPDGRFVAFISAATTLVAGDTNGSFDVFWHDRDADGNGVLDEPGGIVTRRVSVDSAGVEGNADSGDYGLWISARGRAVAFHSLATNLVPGDTNFVDDVFVHEPSTGRTTRVSVDSAGVQSNGTSWRCTISADPTLASDARWVTFSSVATNLTTIPTAPFYEIYVHDRVTKTTTLVSVNVAGGAASGNCKDSMVNADGRVILFETWAADVVAGDTNGVSDAFRLDRATGLIDRISLGIGAEANGISIWTRTSADGKDFAIQSTASNLVAGDNNGVLDVFAIHDAAPPPPDVVSPVQARVFEGSTNNGFPFVTPTLRRYQQIHSDLPAQPLTISKLSFRMNTPANATAYAGTQTIDMELFMGNGPDAMQVARSFAANYTGPRVNVIARKLIVWGPTGVATPPGPQPFTTHMDLPLDAPYVWRPVSPSLTWEAVIHGNVLAGGSFPAVDADAGAATLATTVTTGAGCVCTGRAARHSVSVTAADVQGWLGLQVGSTNAPAGAPVYTAIGFVNPDLAVPGLCAHLLTDLTIFGLCGVAGANGTLNGYEGNFTMHLPNTVAGMRLYLQNFAFDPGQAGVAMCVSSGTEVTVPLPNLTKNVRVSRMFDSSNTVVQTSGIRFATSTLGMGLVTLFQ